MTVSWLKLERYALGELGPEASAEVEAALERDEEARARLQAIRSDVRALPTLDLELPDSGVALPEEEAEVVPLFGWRRLAAVAGVLAAAALALVLVLPPGGEPEARIAWKGGELALGLDRLRGGEVTRGADAFQDGDRFQIRLTCPPGERTWAVRVSQGAQSAEPLGSGQVACGNGIVLPGAFELSGTEPVTVCAGVDEGGAALRSGVLGGEGVVCVELQALGD